MFEVVYKDIAEKEEYINTIKKVLEQCFKEEKIENSKLYVTITLTDGENIRKINKEYRNIDKATDVLSFPMFEKDELVQKIKEKSFEHEDVLGDIVISIPKVEEQAKEYGHSFERELSYMVVHGFYHLMGYDHIKEEDKKEISPNGDIKKKAAEPQSPSPEKESAEQRCKSDYRIYGEFKKVKLLETEYSKLAERMGKSSCEDYIARLDGWLAEGNTKKNHYATILNWWRRDESNRKAKETNISKLVPQIYNWQQNIKISGTLALRKSAAHFLNFLYQLF